MTSDKNIELSLYVIKMRLLTSLDELCKDIGYNLIHDIPTTSSSDYCKQLIWTIGPANRMVVWGLENNQNLSIMNGLRTLLENWANANYVFHAGEHGSAHYLSRLCEDVERYKIAMQELRNNTALGVGHLPRSNWASTRLNDRVRRLGDGPLFQYEYLCRYVHADIWATLNEFDIQNKQCMSEILLTWCIEFINHTLCIISEENTINKELQKRLESLSQQVAAMIAN